MYVIRCYALVFRTELLFARDVIAGSGGRSDGRCCAVFVSFDELTNTFPRTYVACEVLHVITRLECQLNDKSLYSTRVSATRTSPKFTVQSAQSRHLRREYLVNTNAKHYVYRETSAK